MAMIFSLFTLGILKHNSSIVIYPDGLLDQASLAHDSQHPFTILRFIQRNPLAQPSFSILSRTYLSTIAAMSMDNF